MLCQQSWMYLEVIFSAPDIQRQLPSEAKLFIIVDKSWKEIMRRTAKVSHLKLHSIFNTYFFIRCQWQWKQHFSQVS